MAYLCLGSRRALQRAIDDHRLPYHRLGRHLRFYRPELDAWLLATGSGAKRDDVER
jgi:excisionase family DNA binding protein